MKYIGLLSDTHGYLDPRLDHHFGNCDEVWHAGDIGSVEIVHQLKQFKPFKGVYGNIDGQEIRQELPENLFFETEGFRVFITHIGGKPGKYPLRVKKLIEEYSPDLYICGHSHILKVISDPQFNLLHINPGAAGVHGFHQVRTLIRFKLENKKIFDIQVIELGKRSEQKA